MKKLIGVASPAFLFEEENTNLDFYRFSNNYCKRIYECGGIPAGILPDDGRIPDGVLGRFDAFVVCGGKKFWPHHFQVIDHAVKTGKPLIGICLGMQATHLYFKLADYAAETGYDGDLFELYKNEKKGVPPFDLLKVEGHCKPTLRGKEEESKHRVNLTEGSHVAELVGSDHLYAATVHSYRIHDPSPRLTLTGVAEDGTPEVIEYGKQILGVQFHPEVDDKLLSLFSFLFQ